MSLPDGGVQKKTTSKPSDKQRIVVSKFFTPYRQKLIINIFLLFIVSGTIAFLSDRFLTVKNITKSLGNLSAPGAGKLFVANRNSDVYHIAGCKWTKKIKHANIIEFESAEAAEQKHYLPCRNCNPHRAKKLSLSSFARDKVNISRY